jgi:hypothetical protein
MEKLKIGYDAGKIWHIIADKKSVKVLDLKESTKMDIKDIFLALGWLAREGSITFVKSGYEQTIHINK